MPIRRAVTRYQPKRVANCCGANSVAQRSTARLASSTGQLPLVSPPSSKCLVLIDPSHDRFTAEERVAAFQGLQHLPASLSPAMLSHDPTGRTAVRITTEQLQGVEVVLNATRSPLLSDIWPMLPQLKWVHQFSTGVDWVLKAVPQLSSSDVCLTNGRGVYKAALAEWALMSCLYFAKRIPLMQRQQEQRVWQAQRMGMLKGATLGVVGAGDIGMECAHLANAFGMRVLALRKSKKAPSPGATKLTLDGVPLYAANGITFFSANDKKLMLGQCDYVVAALPNTPHTRNFFDEDAFAAMKSSAVFVNLGRGSTVRATALSRALKEGVIAAAACDVHEEEPLPASHELYSAPNFLMYPHTADNIRSSLQDSIECFVAEAHRYHRHGVAGLKNVVNVDRGY